MRALGVWASSTSTKDETMSQDAGTTRRAMLAGTSTLTLAIPAIASTSAIAGPDAELLALGAQIDQILPRLLEINWLGTQSNRAMEKHLRLFSGQLARHSIEQGNGKASEIVQRSCYCLEC
jgi:hypothetical protein